MIVTGTPTEMDVRKLYDHFGVPEIGAVIPHEEIEKLLFLDRERRRYMTVVGRWRRKLYIEHNLYLMAVRGHGFEVAAPKNRIRAAQSGMRGAVRKIRRMGELAARTDRAGLSPDQAKIADHLSSVAASHLLADLTAPRDFKFDWKAAGR